MNALSARRGRPLRSPTTSSAATVVAHTAQARSQRQLLGASQFIIHFDDGKIQERVSLPDADVRILTHKVGACKCVGLCGAHATGRALPLAWGPAAAQCDRVE